VDCNLVYKRVDFGRFKSGVNVDFYTFKALEKPVELKYGNNHYQWGNKKNWVLFAGPDIIEDEGMVLETAQELKKLTQEYGVPWILKCSFDKANRQRVDSYRGPGIDSALKSFETIKSKVGCPMITDVHETSQMERIADIADVIQIPAFLCRQTDLVVAAAKTGKVIHLKKGQFMAPADMHAIVEKVKSVGNHNSLVCDRGTTFGYNRLINDMTGLVEMRSKGTPVIMDVTHSTQQPGAANGTSGGRKDLAPAIARAAMGVGVDGLFIETHPNPDEALCDAATSLPLAEMERLLKHVNAIWKVHQSEA
jgi:2-dehydro-3-deoxyphosphooctonate aldolase (KDO 8-P synthase)